MAMSQTLSKGCFAGSPGSSNSSIGAGPNSPRSPVAVYSPTAAAAAAAAAGVHSHSLYSLSQTVAINQNMYPSYHYQHESMPGWQQGFIQGVGYGQPMRAYRSAYLRQGKRSPQLFLIKGSQISSAAMNRAMKCSPCHVEDWLHSISLTYIGLHLL